MKNKEKKGLYFSVRKGGRKRGSKQKCMRMRGKKVLLRQKYTVSARESMRKSDKIEKEEIYTGC